MEKFKREFKKAWNAELSETDEYLLIYGAIGFIMAAIPLILVALTIF